jgi:hypothetical protein
VHLVTTTVVRLVGALAHESLFRIAMGGSVDRRRSARAGSTTQPLTDQRYVVGGGRVKPWNASREPVEKRLCRGPGGVRFGTQPRFPAALC